MGRPPLPKALRKSVRLSFRVTPAFSRALLAAAKREGKCVAELIAETLEAKVKGGE